MAKAKTFTKVPTAVISGPTAQDVILTDGKTGIGLVGYDGIFAKVISGNIIKSMLAIKVAAKINQVMAAYSTAIPGAVVRTNPTNPKEGDIKTVKPTQDPTGAVTSGQYEVYIFVNSDWRLIFPRG